MKCSKCGNPLKIVKGGMKTDLETTEIKMIHVHGCMNPGCEMSMKEQQRTENVIESFEEEVAEPVQENQVVDINLNITTDGQVVDTIETPIVTEEL